MSLSCFDNLIGIKGECGTPTTPDSGIYAQDLTELHIKNMDKSISEEQNSGFEALQEMIGFSASEMAHDFRLGFMDKYEAKSIIENDVVGAWKKDLKLETSEPTYLRGVRVKIDTEPYTSFFLSEVSVHSQVTGTVDVLVWDLTQSKLLDTITVTTIAGQINSQTVYKKYNADKQKLDLLIATDGDEMYETNISTKSCCNHRYYKNGTARFQGSKVLSASTKIPANVENLIGTAGISLKYSVNCDFDPWLCAQRHALAIPLLYKLGEKVMMDLRYGKRMNSIITLHRDSHEELMLFYREKYTQSMVQIFSNLEVPNNRCFKCRRKVKTSIRLP